jgi:hypothetical protein
MMTTCSYLLLGLAFPSWAVWTSLKAQWYRSVRSYRLQDTGPKIKQVALQRSFYLRGYFMSQILL